MSFLTKLSSSLENQFQSPLDEEAQKLIEPTKQTLQTIFLTRDQSMALDQAIYVLTSQCFEKSENKCQTPEDLTKMFSNLLKTFSFRYIIYQKPSNSKFVNISLTIEKQQMSFCRIVELFWQKVFTKNCHWNNYEFSSSLEQSSKSPTHDFFTLKLFHDPYRRVPHFEMPRARPVSEILLGLTDNQDYVTVPSSIPEEPPSPLSLGQRLSQFSLKEQLSNFSLGLQRFLPTSSSTSTKSE